MFYAEIFRVPVMTIRKLTIRVPEINATTHILLKGHFSYMDRRELQSTFQSLLDNAAINKIAINLAGVEYMDSSALGMLLELRNQSLAANKHMTLSSPSGIALQILDIACFAKIFTID